MDWYKCYPRDLLDACEGLGSTLLVAVYRTVIDRIYETDGPLLNDPASIGRYACVRPHHATKAIADLIELGKLQLTTSGRLSNPRATSELERRNELSETRAKAGSKGGKKQPKTAAGADPRDALAVPSRYPRDALAVPSRCSHALDQGISLAENRHSTQAIASTRAREEIRLQEESPQPPKTAPVRTPVNGLDQMPDFKAKLDPAERLRLVEKLDIVDRVDHPDGEVVSQLTGDIMREARMTVPPSDLVLVGGWVRMGMEPAEIIQIVVRMAASARGGVRGMRYFDAEIRRVHDAKASAESSNMAYFARVLREHTP